LIVDLRACNQAISTAYRSESYEPKYSSAEVNKKICEAMDCFAEGTITIGVKVGQKGMISLKLCRDCINKFTDG
jgi:hypothetical protein